MSYNLNNLFDAQDDVGKDDKAYLPIALKNNDDHIMGCLQVNNSKWRNECLFLDWSEDCLLYTSPSPRDKRQSRMPSSA